MHMGEKTIELDPETEKVFSVLRVRKSMPLLEIAGVTGVFGSVLRKAVTQLSEKKLVTVKDSGSDLESIVSISGSYF
jgi:hypothetical protein